MPTNKVTQKFKKHICFGYQANTNIWWHYRTTVPPSDRNAMDKLNRLPSSLIIPQSDYDFAEIYTLCRNEPSILKHGAEKNTVYIEMSLLFQCIVLKQTLFIPCQTLFWFG